MADFTRHTDAQLALFIQQIGAEMHRRAVAGHAAAAVIAHAAERKVPVRQPEQQPAYEEPGRADLDFVMRLKAALERGQYIKADERVRAAEIAARYPDWYAAQEMPEGSGTGAWRKAAVEMSAPRAKPR